MIDTLQAVDTLKSKGFEEEQARAIAILVTHTNDELATKKDIELLRAEMQTQNTELRADMQSENGKLRADMQSQNAELHTEMTELRADMQAGNAELRADMQAGNAELRAETTELRADVKTLQRNFSTLRWMVGLLYPLIVGVLIALLFR